MSLLCLQRSIRGWTRRCCYYTYSAVSVAGPTGVVTILTALYGVVTILTAQYPWLDPPGSLLYLQRCMVSLLYLQRGIRGWTRRGRYYTYSAVSVAGTAGVVTILTALYGVVTILTARYPWLDPPGSLLYLQRCMVSLLYLQRIIRGWTGRGRYYTYSAVSVAGPAGVVTILTALCGVVTILTAQYPWLDRPVSLLYLQRSIRGWTGRGRYYTYSAVSVAGPAGVVTILTALYGVVTILTAQYPWLDRPGSLLYLQRSIRDWTRRCRYYTYSAVSVAGPAGVVTILTARYPWLEPPVSLLYLQRSIRGWTGRCRYYTYSAVSVTGPAGVVTILTAQYPWLDPLVSLLYLQRSIRGWTRRCRYYTYSAVSVAGPAGVVTISGIRRPTPT